MAIVNVSSASNFEGSTTADPNYLIWTISLDGPSNSPVTVDVRYLAGTASVGASNSGSDAYAFNSATSVTFQPGETSKTVQYRIDADSIDETDETVILEVINPVNASLAGNAPVLRSTGWILDDDGNGNNVAVYVSRPVLIEGNSGQKTAAFEVSLSRPAPSDFSITYATADGSAEAGEDYVATSGTLNFVEGQTTASVSVPVIGDTTVEPSEMFTLDISTPSVAAATSLGSAEIFDDDAGGVSQPTVNVSSASNFEGSTTADPNYLIWTISLDGPSNSPVTVDVRYLAGTASVGASNSGSDAYAFNSATSVTFQPGETSKTVQYRIDADSIDETDETVILEVINPVNASLAGNAPVLRSTGWILDDDGNGNNVAVYVSRPVLIEGNSGQKTAAFEVSLSRPAPSDFSITYATADGSAEAGEDYVATSGTLNFVEGQTTASVSVPVIGDTTVEPSEMFTLDISTPSVAAATSLGSAEIFDDDAGGASQPTVNVSSASNFEGSTTADPNYLIWTISLDGPSNSPVTVDVRYLAGTASVGSSNSGSDAYAFNSATSVTFQPGETSKTVQYRIDADSIDETDETVILEVINPVNASLAGNAPVLRSTGWILDDDGNGNNVAVYVSRPVLIEGNSGQKTAAFEVSLSRPAPSDFSITYATADGSAEAGEDYVATSGTLNFVEGQTTASVSVPVIGDTTVEPSEMFTLDISTPSVAAATSLGSAEIFDDDAGGVSQPTVNVSSASNFEGSTTADPNYLIWTISLDGPSNSPVTVDVRYLAGTASVGASNSGSDAYAFNSATSVTFQPGETSKTVQYRIDADSIDETDETVILEVINPVNASLAGNAPVLRSTGWILDDDGNGNNVAVYVSRPVLIEGNSGQKTAAFEVSLSRPAPSDFSITYATADGSAEAGEDYVATSGTLNFVEGQTTASVSVPVIGDTTVEPSEMFTLDISTPSVAAATSLGSAEIFDDDAGGVSQPTVNVSSASNFEGSTTADPNYLIWTISLDGPSNSPVTVDVRYLAGTASVGASNSGSDAYAFNSATSVTFQPGETSKTVQLRIDADSQNEGDETVFVEVSNPVNAALAGNAAELLAVGVIFDDDGFPGATTGPDSLSGTEASDVIDALQGDDTVRGFGGDDTLNGDAGKDNLRGQDGDDVLNGGPDNDQLFGNSGNDTLNGDGGNDVLFGNIESDSLSGGPGNDQISGNEADDTLSGGDGNDSMFGGEGNDSIDGGAGLDLIQGDDGNDTVNGGENDDQIFGGKDNDVLFGDAGNDLIIGNQGDDNIDGGADDDRLFGIGGADTMDGGSGTDVMFGGTGNDMVAGGTGTDQLFGEDGNDTLDGGADNDKLFGGNDDDSLEGGSGSDQMFGDGGNDFVGGGTDADTLFGGAGDDTLDGGRGAGIDRATGGGGADTFVYQSGDARLVVTDFDASEGDLIDLVGIDPAGFGGWTLTPLGGGSNTLVEFGGGDELRLDGVTVAEVDQSWFV